MQDHIQREIGILRQELRAVSAAIARFEQLEARVMRVQVRESGNVIEMRPSDGVHFPAVFVRKA